MPGVHSPLISRHRSTHIVRQGAGGRPRESPGRRTPLGGDPSGLPHGSICSDLAMRTFGLRPGCRSWRGGPASCHRRSSRSKAATRTTGYEMRSSTRLLEKSTGECPPASVRTNVQAQKTGRALASNSAARYKGVIMIRTGHKKTNFAPTKERSTTGGWFKRLSRVP